MHGEAIPLRPCDICLFAMYLLRIAGLNLAGKSLRELSFPALVRSYNNTST